MTSVEFIEKTAQTITDIRDRLLQEIEELKKVPNDLTAITKAATTYRQTLMALHESGVKYSQELQNFGKKYARESVYAAEFLMRGMDQESIEKSRYELQTNFWDKFILPSMTAAEPDLKEFQSVEKKIKSSSSDFDSEAKSEIKNLKKQLKSKKNKDKLPTADYERKINDIKAAQEKVAQYWDIWKEMWYEKWLKFLCCAFEAQKEQFQKCEALLKSESWKTVVENEPPELVPLSEGNNAVSPQTTQVSQTSIGSLSQAYIGTDQNSQTATLQEVSLEATPPVPNEGTYDQESSEWQRIVSPEGQVYYYNPQTQETSWDPK